MKKSILFAFAILSLFVINNSHAYASDDVAVGTVDYIRSCESNGNVYTVVKVDGEWISFNTKELMSLALAAYLSGKEVRIKYIIGSYTICDLTRTGYIPNDSHLRYFQLQ